MKESGWVNVQNRLLKAIDEKQIKRLGTNHLLRREETFKQWTARAKRCSIEAARQTTGGSMRSVAERLGLTRDSLWSHLRRAKRDQDEGATW